MSMGSGFTSGGTACLSSHGHEQDSAVREYVEVQVYEPPCSVPLVGCSCGGWCFGERGKPRQCSGRSLIAPHDKCESDLLKKVLRPCPC